MDEQLFNRIVHLTESAPNFARILNHDLRLVLQHACVLSPYPVASNLFISGIPYTLDTHRQFNTPVSAIFSRSDRGLPILPADIKEIIACHLSQNQTLQSDLRDQLDSI
jgi:hypothetical protein